MPAYWIARARVDDPVAYKRYADQVPAILAKFEGRVLARGGKGRVLEGPETFQRFVVVEFPSFEAAVACFESPEYVAAAQHRREGGGVVEIAVVEAFDPAA